MERHEHAPIVGVQPQWLSITVRRAFIKLSGVDLNNLDILPLCHHPSLDTSV